MSKRLKKIFDFFIFRFTKFPKRRWIRYDTIISYGGFIVSIAVLTAALSLLNGYQRSLKEGFLGTSGHIYFYNVYQRNLYSEDIDKISAFLDEQPEVKAYAPVMVTHAMLSKVSGVVSSESEGTGVALSERDQYSVRGIIAKSIKWEQDKQPTNYRDLIVKGTGRLENTKDAVIGSKLQEYLNVKLGEELLISSPANMRFTLFGLRTGEIRVRVVGVYSSGVYETDSKTVFLNEQAIADLRGDKNGHYSLMEVSVTEGNIDKANQLSHEWSRMIDYDYHIDSWIDYQGNLFTMLVVQRWVIFIILSFIILIASFGIASNTTKTLMEKKREIGILSAIGADKSMIKAYLMGETTLLGSISIIVGVVLGIFAGWILTKQTMLMLAGDVYFIEQFDIVINPFTIIAIVLVSLFIAIAASWLAIQRISRLTVIETVVGK